MRRRMECPLRQTSLIPHAVRMDSQGKPGDLIIDRYLPNADETARTQAREDLKAFAQVLARVATRRALNEERPGNSRESSGRLKIPEAP